MHVRARLLCALASFAVTLSGQTYEQRVQKALQTVNQQLAKGPFQASWDSLQGYKVPAWYLDAKFGIFIHWGVYSVPAFESEWYPRDMYMPDSPVFKHHVATYGPQSKFGYKDFIPRFKAEKFDPNAWAELFRKAGAKYVIPVAEHHDGFAMYDCSFTDWSAAKMGPKRDVVGELATAVRKQGLHFGASSHRAEHWFFFERRGEFDSDVRDPRYSEFLWTRPTATASRRQARQPARSSLHGRLAGPLDGNRGQIPARGRLVRLVD